MTCLWDVEFIQKCMATQVVCCIGCKIGYFVGSECLLCREFKDGPLYMYDLRARQRSRRVSL